MWTEILKYILPALLVLATAYLMLNKLFKNEEDRRNYELKKIDLPIITPVKLRAYERLTLLLERTKPTTMLLNKVEPDMNCLDLHRILLNDIRREFEHNVSQQIYISNEVWELIKNAHENMLQLVNICASQCRGDEPATKLAEMIIQIYNNKEETALATAEQALKEEVKRLF